MGFVSGPVQARQVEQPGKPIGLRQGSKSFAMRRADRIKSSRATVIRCCRKVKGNGECPAADAITADSISRPLVLVLVLG
ncbi:hypothetical protein K227x_03490 [Rubripirellula lacrimiformis]|uniref:Uncharacterized protein n=1 Tax=Rubripirellula lacrimiformis TaxID=1930273 RepID=A0A517N4N7_9BACT|nr:hypothetical protein K227x_03490 [Rubripirellula lacrimiformis]